MVSAPGHGIDTRPSGWYGSSRVERSRRSDGTAHEASTSTMGIHVPGQPMSGPRLGPVEIVIESAAVATQNHAVRSDRRAGSDTMKPCE